jgi:hypothetical protein
MFGNFPRRSVSRALRLFDVLGDDSWTVYRFLTQHHPELEGDTALSALQRSKVSRVLAAAEIASSRRS